eukprot:TRINITY_DN10914_c0_g2_i1.p1 TRINITY_DN10914_c0_g2~~TRINITY_DN10914_c0_g2_i1.p1  ORF type:complete len:676 (-),score=90.46 TRINITY_DN10914_c0_g2_i1:84-2111(-)
MRRGDSDPEIVGSLDRLWRAVLTICRRHRRQDADGTRKPKSSDNSRSPKAVRGVWVGRVQTSYSLVFILGFTCSLIFGYLRPERLPDPVREQVSRAYDDLLSMESVERILNGTSMLKEAFDSRRAAVTDRVKNASDGVNWLFNNWKSEDERVGVRMAKKGYSVKHPVSMIPGIITAGLELWDGEDCIKSYFRQRIWGSATMLQSILSDPDCWARHLSLNSTTGLDPLQRPHFNRSIRVRPSQGFESSDFFLAGYWLWGLLIEALADIGYDMNSMHMASYDWRLSYADLENRDRYFTRLKQQIEVLVSTTDAKAVIVAHSMGSNVWHYFMQWVTHRVDPQWVNNHIHAEISISSPLLGLPKAFYSLLTGDNRDFASMGAGFSAFVTRIFGPMTRRNMWRSCSSLAMITPIGGEELWGKAMIGRPMLQVGNHSCSVEEARDLLASEQNMPADLERIRRWLLDGVRRKRPEADAAGEHGASSAQNRTPPEHAWANPLAVALPVAPDVKKYAFYGVGVPSDVSAVVREAGDDVNSPKYAIDKDATSDNGFYYADGDYSVPVMSLGLMCLKGWSNPARNPAGTSCTVREYKDQGSPDTAEAGESRMALAAKLAGEVVGVQTLAAVLSRGYHRGKQPSGDHIDILGNDEMLSDVLKVASGSHVESRIVSDLKGIADKWSDG